VHSRLKYLVDQYLQNKLSTAEKAELLSGISDSENDSELLDLLEDKWKRDDFVSRTLSEEDSASILQQVVAVDQSQPEVHEKVFRIVPWWRKSVAIILILLCVTGAYLYFKAQEGATGVTLAKNLAPLSDSLKRGELAILTLSDGSKVQLTKLKAGQVAIDGNTIVSSSGPVLAYKSKSAADHNRLNTVATKKGQEYEVILPDGSKVWLNGSSSITFPVAFNLKERNVSVTGEVLFKVSKDAARPFRVSTPGPSVEVLGTFFNVNAYFGQHQVKTTLIEGSVALHSGTKTVRMLPGQQGTLDADGNFAVTTTVNAEDAIAWTDGIIMFRNDSLHTVIRELETWYDVYISDKTDGTVQGFSGPIQRNLSLPLLAEFLSERLKVKLDGNKMILTNKQ
jgi:transmembrane sensor